MPVGIGRDEVQRLLGDGAQLVEVLPEAEFAEEHLPEAISLPLRSLTGAAAAAALGSGPIVVYCWDSL